MKKKDYKLKKEFIMLSRDILRSDEFSLTGVEPNWFEIENRLPYCVKKA